MNFRRFNNTLLGAALLSTVLLTGCGSPQSGGSLLPTTLDTPDAWRPLPGLKELTYEAADDMVAQLQGDNRKSEIILPASFVDDNDLTRTSAMGRVLAQQMASRFIQADFTVLEIKVRKSVRLRKGEGQFLLSRELEDVATNHKATAVLVGSYVESRSLLFVNAQLILLNGGVVLASQDFKVPLTFELRALLTQTGS